MVENPVTIDESLRLLFGRLEGALGVFFRSSEIDRVFSDARDNQRDGKEYVFFESPRIRVTGCVEEYEPETIEISVDAPQSLVKRCRRFLDHALDL